MAGNIWVIAEQWRGQLSEITYEVLALGKELATVLGCELQAVLLGHNVKPLAAHLGKANSVLCLDHPALDTPVPETYAEALAPLIRARSPHAVLMPLTNVSLGVATLVADQLEVSCVNFCKDAHIVDGVLQSRSLLYGGKMEAIVTPTRAPAMLGVLPGVRPPEEGRSEAVPPVEDIPIDVQVSAGIRWKRYIEPEIGDVDISKQDILVSVGRGLQSQDNVAAAEELAQILGGAVCGSRPVIDQGWLPLSRQVGKSGVVVKPKLYLAAGISGAPEHVEGMKNSDLIVAINTDEQAPMFHVAHYGSVADVMDVLPVLTEAVRHHREVKSHA